MSQTEDSDFISPLLSTGTFTQLERELEGDIILTPKTLANSFKAPHEGLEEEDVEGQIVMDLRTERTASAGAHRGTHAAHSDVGPDGDAGEEAREVQVRFKEPAKVTKMMNCTYLEANNTLYVRHMCQCSVVVRVLGGVPADCQLHLSPRFSLCTDAISCCPYHARHGHLVRIDPSLHDYPSYNVTYTHQDDHQLTCLDLKPTPRTEVLEVVLPVVFTCRSSCQGGIHKRPFHVVYSVCRRGRKLVERSVNTWVGDCPGRARLNAEERATGAVNENIVPKVEGDFTQMRNHQDSNASTTGAPTTTDSSNTLTSFSTISNEGRKRARRSAEQLKENQGTFSIFLRTYEEWKMCNRFKNLFERHSSEGCVCKQVLGQDVCIIRLLSRPLVDSR